MQTESFLSSSGTIQEATNPPRGPRQPRGGFRRGDYHGERGRSQNLRGRGRGRARGAVQGRGNHADHEQSRRTSEAVEQIQRRLSAASQQPNIPAERIGNASAMVVDEDVELCFICASSVVHNAISPCNHRTCHICALRLRALYKTKACAHCRTNAEFVAFADDASKRFEDFGDNDFVKMDDTLGIKYEKNEIFEDTVLLLRYNCPDSNCDVACYGWPDLHKHVRNVHHKVMCDLCTRNKKVFTHEHDLFTPHELRQHEKYGDDNPGAVDQSGFRGHPECGFCRQRFYGDDELYTHCREKHERCHICDRRHPDQQHQYYLDYNALEVHFRKDHFLCLDQECLDKKFVVFATEMDLKAHQLESHRDGLSRDARREARLVDMSGFDYRTPHRESRGGRREREGRGRGRGRDPNVEALPHSSAQPLRRDELAFQRQLAIHSAQSISNRTFGGQLTSTDVQPASIPSSSTRTHQQPTPSTDNLPPSLDTLTLSSTSTTNSTHPLSPQDTARALRHAAVTDRASTLLHHSPDKLSTFRSKVSSYTRSAIPAAGLIDAFFTIFDCPSSDLGTLIKELADIFEIQSKRDDLLKAWNDWRAVNEDYPSLPGPNGVPAGNPAAAGSMGGGKRILKLKSSTTQSGRSAVGRQVSWGDGKVGGEAFPGLPATKAQPRPPPWVASTSTATAATARVAFPARSSRPPVIGPTAQGRAAPGQDAFPALPAAQKPGMNVSRPGFLGGAVRRDHHGVGSASAWGKGVAVVEGSGGSGSNGGGGDEDGEDAGAGKGKGRKRQTLFHWG